MIGRVAGELQSFIFRQQKTIDLLITGKTDTEAAQRSG
jgi:hypothetical protein